MSTLVTLLILGLVARTAWERWGGRNDGAGVEDLLARAEAEGIISAEQRLRILAQAHERRSGVQLSGTTWLAIFAGLFVVAGISLLIAHNWNQIGPVVRVAAFLGALALVGELAIRYRGRSLAVGLPLEVLWLFFPLLGIGLYGQTFHLSGDPVQPFLVWLGLTVPLAWLSARAAVPAIHTVALVSVLFSGNFAADGMLSLTGATATRLAPVSPLAWTLSLVILGVVGVQCARLLPRGHRRQFFAVVALWVFALLVASTPFQLVHTGWLTLAAVSLATLWLVAQLATGGSAPERMSGVLVWLSTIYGATFFWHVGSPPDQNATTLGMAVTLAALAGAAGGALALPRGRLSNDPTWHTAGKILLAAPALLATLFLVADVSTIQLAAVVMNVLLVAIAAALMWHGSTAREVTQINLGILVLLVVLVTRFLDVFGSLLEGGVGFIVAGLLLAALAYVLERARRRLIHVPEGSPT